MLLGFMCDTYRLADKLGGIEEVGVLMWLVNGHLTLEMTGMFDEDEVQIKFAKREIETFNISAERMFEIIKKFREMGLLTVYKPNKNGSAFIKLNIDAICEL